MKIDDQVEQRVRDTLHWVIKRKPAEFDKALQGLPDEATRKAALELLVAVILFAVADTFGRRPFQEEIAALADQISEMEEWSAADSAEIATFINTIFAGEPLAHHLPADSVMILSFIIAGSLLSSHPKTKGTWWFDYLDKVEAAIEAGA